MISSISIMYNHVFVLYFLGD